MPEPEAARCEPATVGEVEAWLLRTPPGRAWLATTARRESLAALVEAARAVDRHLEVEEMAGKWCLVCRHWNGKHGHGCSVPALRAALAGVES